MVSIQQVSGAINDRSLNNIIVILVAVILFLVVLYYKMVNRRKTLLANRIPGPDGIFFSLPVSIGAPEKLWLHFFKISIKYKNTLSKLWMLDHLLIFPKNPEEIEAVVTNPDMFLKPKEYNMLNESILGDGIFSNKKFDEWKKNRKMVAVGLKYSMLKSFIPIFHEEAKFLSQVLYEKREINSDDCEISSAIGMATMEIIGRAALGVKLNAQKNAKHVFVENFRVIQKVWAYRVSYPWFLDPSLFKLSSIKRKHDISQSSIYDFVDDLIHRKYAELKDNINSQEEPDEECIGIKYKSYIEILLENGHQMSLKQLRHEVITIMVGGHETTAMAIPCIIFMLAHHQDVQNKVLEELMIIFSSGDPDRQPTLDDLQKMDYLERVIKETLRLYAVVPMFGRSVEKETMIGDYLIPAGSTFMIFPPLIHLNAEFYPDPEKFNPDNFSPEACSSRHPYSFISFSAGYRNCPGIRYAMLSMKTVISTLVRSYRFRPSDKCPKPENLNLMFAFTKKFVDGGVHVKLEARR
ncbi:cytochrome P450 4C1-like [Adelges cooleyi]|uniref:cytochrome P450 4C1-like n=1 Tax=Adelges cooleyi TaxID=133065 RepID=UPI00217FFC3D|nr:cytochrome P450 4C1-like [Adelges cooleyi]